MNAKGQVTIGGWLTPTVAPPHPSSVLEVKGEGGGAVGGGGGLVLKMRRVHCDDDGDDDGDDDDDANNSSSSSSSQSSAPPSPKYDEGISTLPPPPLCTPTPSSCTPASARDLQLQLSRASADCLTVLSIEVLCDTRPLFHGASKGLCSDPRHDAILVIAWCLRVWGGGAHCGVIVFDERQGGGGEVRG